MPNTTRKNKRIINTPTTRITTPIRIPNTITPTITNTRRLKAIEIVDGVWEFTFFSYSEVDNPVSTGWSGKAPWIVCGYCICVARISCAGAV